MIGAGNRNHPRPLLRVAVLRDLIEVFLGEESGVGHQALVHRAELVDAEFRVGDEAAVSALASPGLLGQQQMFEHMLGGLVAETDLVDERRGGRGEQIGAQRVEFKTGGCVIGDVVGRARGVTVVDEPEQRRQRFVKVGAVFRCG